MPPPVLVTGGFFVSIAACVDVCGQLEYREEINRICIMVFNLQSAICNLQFSV
jgi:hypothetical protein